MRLEPTDDQIVAKIGELNQRLGALTALQQLRMVGNTDHAPEIAKLCQDRRDLQTQLRQLRRWPGQ